MNGNLNQITGAFGVNTPSWVTEMFSHPILFVLCLVTIGFGYLEVKRKIKDGELRLTDKSARVVVIASIFLMMFIATR